MRTMIVSASVFAALALPIVGPAQAQFAAKYNAGNIKAPPVVVDSAVFKQAYNRNLLVRVPGATAEVTVTLNGNGRVKGAGFYCSVAAGKTSTICTRNVPENSPILLEAMGRDGTILTAWAGACSGASTKCAITPKGKMQIAATFGAPPVQQTTSIKVNIPDGAGSVTASSLTPNAVSCTKPNGGSATGTCAIKVPLGSKFSLIASPSAGSAFNGWESEQDGCAGFECAFTAQDPVVLTARFGNKTATSKLTLLYMRGWLANLAITSSPNVTFDCIPANGPDVTKPNPPATWLSTCTADVPTGTQLNISGAWAGRLRDLSVGRQRLDRGLHRQEGRRLQPLR